jgi:ribosomal protein S12 methylthiotransferase
MAGQVPAEVAQERLDRLMAAQQQIAFDLAAERIGERTTVMIEEAEDDGTGLRPARSPREAPDVDPLVLVEGADAFRPGDFVEVEIVGSAGYDCVAQVTSGAS